MVYKQNKWYMIINWIKQSSTHVRIFFFSVQLHLSIFFKKTQWVWAHSHFYSLHLETLIWFPNTETNYQTPCTEHRKHHVPIWCSLSKHQAPCTSSTGNTKHQNHLALKKSCTKYRNQQPSNAMYRTYKNKNTLLH